MCTLCAVQEVGGAMPLTLYTLPWPAWTRQPRDAQLTCLEADPTASSHRTQLTTESPLWVGAWWVGFLGAGAAAFLIAVPILGYPRQLPGGCPPKCARPAGSCGPLRSTGESTCPCLVGLPSCRVGPASCASPPPGGHTEGISWGGVGNTLSLPSGPRLPCWLCPTSCHHGPPLPPLSPDGRGGASRPAFGPASR